MRETRSLKIRMISLLLCVLCLLPVLPVAAEPAEEMIPEETQTITAGLVYSSPSASSRIVGRMEDGTEITVYDRSSDYYKIDCYDTIGYIAASQVTQEADGSYYISCKAESDHTVRMEQTEKTELLLLQAAILELAKAELGDPYVYGATGPNGFDCSGFTSYIYGQLDRPLARICSGQMAMGLIVSREELQVGDLIFFGGSVGSVFHVGIYVGDGQIIHASSSKGISYAQLESQWFASNYLCARRMIVTDKREVRSDSEGANNLLSRRIAIPNFPVR